jgi:phage tail sheath gpL-like
MGSTLNPKQNFSLLPAAGSATTGTKNELIVGTIPAAATATVDTLLTDIQLKTKGQLDSLFGANSDIRNRIQQWKNSNNNVSKLSAKVVAEEGVATVGVGTATLSGTATEEGTITVNFVDAFQYSFGIDVLVDDTHEDIATAIASAFTAANFPMMPVAITEATGVVTVTSIDKNSSVNNYPIQLLDLPEGISVVVVDVTGGGADPVVTTILDNLEGLRFTGILWPAGWYSQSNVVKSFLDGRFNTDNAIMDGVAFLGKNDTFANSKSSVDSENSQSMCYMGNTVSLIKPADWEAAYFAGLRSRRLTAGVNIADIIVTTNGVLDSFGGDALASLPLFNSPMANTEIVEPNNLYSFDEQKDLEASGFTVIGVDSSGTSMIMGAVVTTYKTLAGSENLSFKFLEYVDTGSTCRERFFNAFKAQYAQSRLTTGSLVKGRSMENEDSIRTFSLSVYKKLADDVLTVKGFEAEEFFKTNMLIGIDVATGVVTMASQLKIVVQGRQFNYALQLNFTVGEG